MDNQEKLESVVTSLIILQPYLGDPDSHWATQVEGMVQLLREVLEDLKSEA